DLDLRQPGRGELVDQRDLVRGGNETGLDLEAVAGGDFLDVHTLAHQMIPRSRRPWRCASVRPSPASTSSVCSPRRGPPWPMRPGVRLSLGNTPGTLRGPAKVSTCSIMRRAA